VRRDPEGFLCFIGRRDEMIETSGYRVSPTEVEEEAYATGLVADAVAVGVPHPSVGQVIALVASPTAGQQGSDAALPRNPIGKFDRIRLQQRLSESIAWSAEE
jgi:acyl-coenzyme A synthetase/AMP-(fatty) acid ligase